MKPRARADFAQSAVATDRRGVKRWYFARACWEAEAVSDGRKAHRVDGGRRGTQRNPRRYRQFAILPSPLNAVKARTRADFAHICG
ncbi:MAG: hypothetical protein Q7T82_19580 [Armatimonadota bacterium]|nr:hypothetical protein [Armatimonadota bacterium]